MAYEVTANRKRPRVFEELSGQSFVVSTLMSSLSQNRIAHAYLFSGPRGVGKTSAARILAKALNCDNGPNATPCGDCPNCHEIASGHALDVIEIDGASNTSVNDVREIKNEVLFAPNSSRYKVYIIDEVHMLSNSAFNALLKTIEEPPPYIVFVFATTEIHKVPATIRSRCQQFHFQLISIEIIQEKLAEAAEEQNISVDRDALFWIAKESTGSLRDAYTLLDQIVSFSQGEVTMEKIRDKLGLIGTDTITELVEGMAQGNVTEVISQAETVLSHGVSIEQFVIDLTEYFRSLLLLKHGITRESLLGSRKELFSAVVLETFSSEQIETAIDMLLTLYRNIRYSVNQRYELELLLSRLAALREKVSPGVLYKKLKAMRDALGMSAVNPHESRVGTEPSAAQPQKPEARKVLTEADIAHCMRSLKQTRPSLAAMLEKAPWSLEQGALIFTVETPYAARTASQDIPVIAHTLAEAAGQEVPVRIRPREEPKQAASPAAASSDDTVDIVRHLFRGEIVTGGTNESNGSP